YGAVLEVFQAPTSKWTALTRIGDALGIPPADMVAVGDDVNDVAMLSGAGVGVAMGNAGPEARAAADLVAPSNAEDGVAWVVERLFDA
ncbi:MAG: HAD family phosphatase, partial [Planctomycetes bacterium]|nr:HAD family phosphatase [Planctomycetota bacterium]